MSGDLLFDRGGYRIELRDHCPEAAVTLLAGTVWGTEGRTQWRHLKVAEIAPRLVRPRWVCFFKGGNLLATMAFLHRQITLDNQKVDAYYIRYLSISPQIRGGRAAAKASPDSVRDGYIERSPLRSCVARLFESPELLHPERRKGQPSVFYAYVELENHASYQICQKFGFHHVRDFSAIPFSRISPQARAAAERLDAAQMEGMCELIRRHHTGEGFFFEDHIGHAGSYHVLRRQGQVLAGLQAWDDHWQVMHLQGAAGNLLMKVLPHTPLLKRVFNPSSFRPLMVEAVYHKPGHEQDLMELLETVLAEKGLHTALLWVDPNGRLAQWLKHSARLGILARIKGDANGQLVARFENCEGLDVGSLFRQDAYISAFDVA